MNQRGKKKNELGQRIVSEDNLRDLQANIKCYNIRIIGVPKQEDKRKAMRKYLRT